jgi:hypothetical protein
MTFSSKTASKVLGLVVLLMAGTCTASAPNSRSYVGQADCYRLVGEEVYFLGTEESCLKNLPIRAISGYWVVGHEYSAFFLRVRDISDPKKQQNLWFEIGKNNREKTKRYYGRDGMHIYSISILGSSTARRGIYGNGLFKGVVFLRKLLSIKEIEIEGNSSIGDAR